MEKELNIAAILKDKPNAKLWSPIVGNCTFKGFSSKNGAIVASFVDKDGELLDWDFNEYGKTFSAPKEAEVCLFPSKSMQNWSKFAWKKGDVLVSNDSDSHIIFKGFSKNDYTTFEGKHWISVSKKRYLSCLNMQNVQDYHIEDNKDAAQTYINTIEENSGGKLNRETLEVEKTQPEFKDGDIAYADYGHKEAVFIVSGKTNLSEGYNSFIALDLRGLTLDMGCRMSFFKKDLCKLRLATAEEKQQLFSALAKEGKAWNVEKKMIVDLPKKCEFKAMDWCLMRDKKETWKLCQFSFFDDGGYEAPYNAVGGNWFDECIPYNEETKHLLGTTDEWKGGEG